MGLLDIVFRYNNRITALIVTLVILIILSTISISAIFGENGLIKKAQEMRAQQSNKITTEEEKLNKLSEEYTNVMGGGGGTVLGQSYSIPKINSGLKSYYVSQTGYTGKFGTKDVLTATGTGEDRFYVMSLTDIDGKKNGTRYCWYDAAYDYKMSDYATTTSTSFGSGKTNTTNMIAKWNSSGYGEQNAGSSPDMWGAIQIQVAQGWFVASRDEWAAFAGAFGITSSNHSSTFDLSYYYWSSSQSSNRNACRAGFSDSGFYYNTVSSIAFVRLSATF